MAAQQLPLELFHPAVRGWFERVYSAPSPPQELGWPSIAAGNNTLILAPTGSGKTLTAFLWAINHLVEQHLNETLAPGVRVLYISPLKALNNDIERNLEAPLQGIRAEANRLGLSLPFLRTAVRTGDTTQARRAAMIKQPPDILITTPESLYLMLTSAKARGMFSTVQYVIVDEIHALCGNKRGVHLSLSLERLQEIAVQECVRIGLSATQRPLERIAAFLGGNAPPAAPGSPVLPRPVQIVNAGRKKETDLRVVCAADDFSLLPQESVWPLIFQEILVEIRRHRTTLIFVNNRRLAERIAAKLNELITGTPAPSFNLYAVPQKTAPMDPDDETPAQDAGVNPSTEPLVQAYHGSMSRESREQMEAELKAGRLRALVATSSLELGIDIGSIDLVIQVQSPKGIARGLQRIGRSGHLVSATSKGRIFATHREDLVESTVVARAMVEHEVEETTIPENCLDVLAQQIVAMVSIEPREIDPLYDLLRRSYCYRTLPRDLFIRVLEMLAGRYTHEAFRDLRARISWDKVHGVLRALPGTGHLAITGGGTIADRGYFGVYLEDGRTKVGEVDEEFIYESRTGDTFLLGTSVWRMVNIDATKVTVSPAPGQPARMPFWRGEGIGRSYALGARVGAFRRLMAQRIDDPGTLPWLQREFPVDSRAAWNILEYYRRQQEATGVIPHDNLLVVEGFRDEVGDPRLVVHSSYGRRVNGLLGLWLSRVLHTRTGVEPQMLYNDDGILLRCNDAEAVPLDLFDGLNPKTVEDAVLEEVLQSPVFGGQFRQNAGRALLMPRTTPGKRTPLWLQRLRAADLLQAVRQFEDFPIVIETVREVLNDVLDFPHFREVIGRIASGDMRVRTVQTEIPSPFTASLLFDFIAVYMYEWDQPRADRLSQYLAINRELLGEVVDLESVSSMIRPEAIQTVERRLQHVEDTRRARTPEELMELLIRIGDLSGEELLERCAGDGRAMADALEADQRIVRVRLGSAVRWVAGEDRQTYARLDTDREADRVLRRFVEHHGPITTAELADRYAISEDRIRGITARWEGDRNMARGRFRPPGLPGTGEPQWCFRPNLERIHRQTISILRKEIQPCSLEEFTFFLQSRHHLAQGSLLAGGLDIVKSLEQLEGLPLPAEIWERDILFRRVPGFTADLLDRASVAGHFVWSGAGAGRLLVFQRGNGALFLESRAPDERVSLTEAGARVLDFLERHGASFLTDIRAGTNLSLAALNSAMAELFWDGQTTNDAASELFQLKRSSRADPDAPVEPVRLIGPRSRPGIGPVLRSARKAIRTVPGWNGRWSLLGHPGVMGDEVPPEKRAGEHADLLLRRYGVVAREFAKREDLLPWPFLAGELQQRELRGELRRGYFVKGLSGMQYATPATVEELRESCSVRGSETPVVLLNACDPANPLGPGIEAPEGFPRITRLPGNYVVFHSGLPVLLAENYGSRLWSAHDTPAALMREAVGALLSLTRLPGHLRPVRSIHVELCNGTRPALDSLCDVLSALGFVRDANQTMRYEGFI
jgi:ATP-dependent helicase Lhr and Lhr-like helicase